MFKQLVCILFYAELSLFMFSVAFQFVGIVFLSLCSKCHDEQVNTSRNVNGLFNLPKRCNQYIQIGDQLNIEKHIKIIKGLNLLNY